LCLSQETITEGFNLEKVKEFKLNISD
jgi:hypothetical protein